MQTYITDKDRKMDITVRKVLKICGFGLSKCSLLHWLSSINNEDKEVNRYTDQSVNSIQRCITFISPQLGKFHLRIFGHNRPDKNSKKNFIIQTNSMEQNLS
jgi:hypothetical protein